MKASLSIKRTSKESNNSATGNYLNPTKSSYIRKKSTFNNHNTKSFNAVGSFKYNTRSLLNKVIDRNSSPYRNSRSSVEINKESSGQIPTLNYSPRNSPRLKTFLRTNTFEDLKNEKKFNKHKRDLEKNKRVVELEDLRNQRLRLKEELLKINTKDMLSIEIIQKKILKVTTRINDLLELEGGRNDQYDDVSNQSNSDEDNEMDIDEREEYYLQNRENISVIDLGEMEDGSMMFKSINKEKNSKLDGDDDLLVSYNPTPKHSNYTPFLQGKWFGKFKDILVKSPKKKSLTKPLSGSTFHQSHASLKALIKKSATYIPVAEYKKKKRRTSTVKKSPDEVRAKNSKNQTIKKDSIPKDNYNNHKSTNSTMAVDAENVMENNNFGKESIKEQIKKNEIVNKLETQILLMEEKLKTDSKKDVPISRDKLPDYLFSRMEKRTKLFNPSVKNATLYSKYFHPKGFKSHTNIELNSLREGTLTNPTGCETMSDRNEDSVSEYRPVTTISNNPYQQLMIENKSAPQTSHSRNQKLNLATGKETLCTGSNVYPSSRTPGIGETLRSLDEKNGNKEKKGTKDSKENLQTVYQTLNKFTTTDKTVNISTSAMGHKVNNSALINESKLVISATPLTKNYNGSKISKNHKSEYIDTGSQVFSQRAIKNFKKANDIAIEMKEEQKHLKRFLEISNKQLGRNYNAYEEAEMKSVRELKLNNLSILYAKLYDKNFLKDKERENLYEKAFKGIDHEKENKERYGKLKKSARSVFKQVFSTIERQDELFQTNKEYEPSPYERNLSKLKSKRCNLAIARNIMQLEGIVFLDSEEKFKDNAKFELMKEINSVENLEWMIKKVKTMKNMHTIKNIS